MSVLKRWTGSAWEEVGLTADAIAAAEKGAPNGVATLDANGILTAAQHGTGVSPLAHGAIGDGTTDDTTAMLAAAAAAIAAELPLVSPPGKTYRMTADFPVATGARWDFNGSYIDLRTDGSATGRRLLFSNVTDVQIRNLRISCSNATARNGLNGIVHILGGSDILLEDIWITGGEGVGIMVMSATTATADGAARLRIVRPRITGVWADGIHVTRGAHDVWIVDAEVWAVGDDAISLTSILTDGVATYEPVRNVQIVNADVHDQTAATVSGVGSGIMLYGAVDCSVLGGQVRTCTTASGFGVGVSALTSGGIGVETRAASESCLVEGVRTHNCKVGASIGLALDTRINGLMAFDHTDSGMHILGATRTRVASSSLDQNAGFGVYAVGGTGNRLSTTSLTGNVAAASNVDAGTTVDTTCF